MKFNYYVFCIWCGLAVFVLGDSVENEELSEESRSLASALSPIGIVKAARRLVTNGAQMFRGRIQEGVKVAQMLKEDVEGVAHLMKKIQQASLGSEAKDDIEIGRDGVLGGIFRFMGMDSSSIGRVVLNVLIFFAEMLTTSMLGKDASNVVETRMIKENLMEWVLTGRNKKVDQILRDARDKNLPDSIISILQQKTGNQTACVQLLICKMSPFIWGVQKTVDERLDPSRNGNGTENIVGRFMNFSLWNNLVQIFPDKHRFISFGDNCEKRFPNCKLLKFSRKGKNGNENV